MMPELITRQQRFIDEYLVDGNGTRAAIAAGYARAGSRVTACRLLTKPNVQAALEARQAADATRLRISREHVVAGLLEAVEQGRAQRDPAVMIRGLAEIGRMLGFYAPELKRVALSVEQSQMSQQMHAMTDEQLMAIAAGAVFDH